MKQAVGNWVQGDSFWGRQMEKRLFAQYIGEGHHLLLVAQRRMGKTSLLKEMELQLKQQYLCVFVDFQQAATASEAIVALSLAIHPHKSLWAKASALFDNAVSGLVDTVDKISMGKLSLALRTGLNSGNWKAKANGLMAVLAAADKPVLLLLDEVPILVNRLLKGGDYKITPERRAQADEFMSWLRDSSLRHQGRIRIVVTGSIGLEPVLRQAGLSATMNNFLPFELPPWDEGTAIGCLEELAKEYQLQFQEGAARAIVTKLGYCIPHHVQVFFHRAYERGIRRDQMSISVTDVEDIYHQEMLDTRGHAELSHYEDRLKIVLGEDLYKVASDMLTEAAVVGCLSVDACMALSPDITDQSWVTVQREVLLVLEHDGYLKNDSEGYHFVSSLVRDWWKARHTLGFTPILKRGSKTC